MTMGDGYSLSEQSIRVAEGGIRGMIKAACGVSITSYVMIEAALHVLAAWVASSQTGSTTAERDADFEELERLLASFIDYHRSARWLPNPHRVDN
jgi:hypothetical protein